MILRGVREVLLHLSLGSLNKTWFPLKDLLLEMEASVLQYKSGMAGA